MFLFWLCGLWYVEGGNSRPGLYYIWDCTSGMKVWFQKVPLALSLLIVSKVSYMGLVLDRKKYQRVSPSLSVGPRL
jgi:hypothetical protein